VESQAVVTIESIMYMYITEFNLLLQNSRIHSVRVLSLEICSVDIDVQLAFV